jgi:hypothetical protein
VHRKQYGKELSPNIKRRISALVRIGMPEDVARVGLLLASDDAAFVTAAPFIVDGGYTTGTHIREGMESLLSRQCGRSLSSGPAIESTEDTDEIRH